MSDIIELVGIPASGKSYLLERYQEEYNPEWLNCIDFGQYLQERAFEDLNQDLKDGVVPTDEEVEDEISREYVQSLIGEIKQDLTPAVMTSHVVHYNGDEFDFVEDMEEFTDAQGFMYVFPDVEDVVARREARDDRDYRRNISSFEEVSQHRDITLEKTLELAHRNGVPNEVIYNQEKRTDENLEVMDGFFNEVLR